MPLWRRSGLARRSVSLASNTFCSSSSSSSSTTTTTTTTTTSSSSSSSTAAAAITAITTIRAAHARLGSGSDGRCDPQL